MSLVYKILCEVKLMHEFYVTSKDGKNAFDLVNQTDRINFLLNQFSKGVPSINNDVDFIFPIDLEEQYKSQYLKIIPSYSGFKIAIRVNQKILPDTSLVYEPFVPLPDDFNIFVQLKKTSDRIGSITNSGLNPVPAMNIFANENVSGAKTFPFLTNSISAFDGAQLYTQGDIASYGLNDTREYYNDGTIGQWENVSGGAFATENDQLVVPVRFYYSFFNDSNITGATFILRDHNSNVVKTINVSASDFIQKTLLDFSDVSDVVSMPGIFVYPNVMFSLEVSGSNGYSKTHTLIFNDSYYGHDYWGVINLKTKVTNPLLNLLANDGYLNKRRVPPGVWNEAPVFEIAVKSKFPFWRFINEKGGELKLAPSLTDYLFKENKILLSKRPRSVADGYFLLQKEGTTDTVYVPNPLNYDLKKDDKERLCLDIVVPESDLFPVV